MTKKTFSKSKRVNLFLDEHPDARYKEIQEALGKYGIKTHDIANAITARRKKAQALAGETMATRKPGRPPRSQSLNTSPHDELSDTALKFINKAGGIDQAIGMLQLISNVIKATKS